MKDEWEREEAGERQGTGEGRWTTPKWQTMAERRKSDGSTDGRRRKRVWVAAWLSAGVWICEHTQSSSDWHRNCFSAQQAFPSNTPWLLYCTACQLMEVVRLATFSCGCFQLKGLMPHHQTVFEVPEAVVKTICFEDAACCRCRTAGKLWETVFERQPLGGSREVYK